MKRMPGEWKAVDVLADGSISRVAVQRSDFRSLLASGDAPALLASKGAGRNPSAREGRGQHQFLRRSGGKKAGESRWDICNSLRVPQGMPAR